MQHQINIERSSSGSCKATNCSDPFSYINSHAAFEYANRINSAWKRRADRTRNLHSQLPMCGVEWNDVAVVFPPLWNFSSPQMLDVVQPLLTSGDAKSRGAGNIVLEQLTRPRPPIGNFRGPAIVKPLVSDLERDGFATFGAELGFSDILQRTQTARVVEEAFANLERRKGQKSGASMIPYVKGVEPVVEHMITTLGHVVLHYVGVEAELEGFAAFRLYPEVRTPATREHPQKPQHPSTSALWHHDRCGRRIKVYIFLQAVTDATHPTKIVPGSHRNTYFSYGDYFESRFSSHYVSHLNATPMLGVLGDGFIFDTNTIHRGKPGMGLKRDVLMFEFRMPRDMAMFRKAEISRQGGSEKLCNPTASQPNTSFTLSRIRRHHMQEGGIRKAHCQLQQGVGGSDVCKGRLHTINAGGLRMADSSEAHIG